MSKCRRCTNADADADAAAVSADRLALVWLLS
jgi:hypothetical protein